MSCFTDFHRQLADRTIKNYDFIKTNIDNNKEKYTDNIFEVTQLINSLLGIIVLIKESELFDNKLEDIKFNKEWGLPTIPKKYKENNSNKIIKHLRNATAHMNIIPQPKIKGRDIKTITAYTGSFRTPIPEIKGQLFRLKKDSCSGNKRTLLAGVPE